jgi:hypothetical protein
MSPVVIIALVVGGILLLGAVACAGLGLFWARSARDVEQRAAVQAQAEVVKEADPAKADAGTRRVYTPEEFRQRVIGKTPDEVRAALGEPDQIREDGNVVRWTYRGRLKDPEPGKAAPTPVVVFRNGKAVEVQY